VRELAPALFFWAAHPGFDTPKQPKSHPLESITYEMQISQAFYFDIPNKMMGGGTER